LVQTPDAAASRLFNVKFGVRGAGQWQRKNMFMEKCEHDTKHGFCFELFFFVLLLPPALCRRALCLGRFETGTPFL
jgi:hypothetical protein